MSRYLVFEVYDIVSRLTKRRGIKVEQIEDFEDIAMPMHPTKLVRLYKTDKTTILVKAEFNDVLAALNGWKGVS